MATFDAQLLAQLKTWNLWWQFGKEGIARYKDPEYKRELYPRIREQMHQGNQIVSIVGMRQVGKSTIMRQLIRELLESGTRSDNILYISFDDPFIRTRYDAKRVFDTVVETYTVGLLRQDLHQTEGRLYFFLDEIHQIPGWEKILKAYYDRAFPITYIVSGSSSLRLQFNTLELE